MSKVINDWCLKISLTDKCNYRCFYCNDFQKSIVEGKKCLTNDEIKEILKAAYEAGISKVHWTGGEPSIAELMLFSNYAKELGYVEQNITTNGYLMYDKLEKMIENGLVRTNISLDSLSEKKYEEITKVNGLPELLKVIKLSSQKVKLTKINVCLMKENVEEIADMIDYVSTLGENTIIKFFELWKFKPEEVYLDNHVDPEIIKQELMKLGELEILDDIKGNNPNVDYYRIKEKNVKVGIVKAPKSYKCGGPSCKKIRVYSHGRTCEGRKIVEGSYDEKVETFKEIMDRRTNTVVSR